MLIFLSSSSRSVTISKSGPLVWSPTLLTKSRQVRAETRGDRPIERQTNRQQPRQAILGKIGRSLGICYFMWEACPGHDSPARTAQHCTVQYNRRRPTLPAGVLPVPSQRRGAKISHVHSAPNDGTGAMWLPVQARQQARYLQSRRLAVIVSGVVATAPGRVFSPISTAPCPHVRSARMPLSKARQMLCRACSRR